MQKLALFFQRNHSKTLKGQFEKLDTGVVDSAAHSNSNWKLLRNFPVETQVHVKFDQF